MLSKDRRRWIFLIILVLAFVLRLPNINKSLSGDEAYTVSGASNDLGQIFTYLSYGEPHPPLTYIFLHFWLFVGNSDAWIRLLFVLFGVGVCWASYLVGREYVNDKFGLLTMLFVATSPGQIYLSQYVRSYILAAFFITLSVYFFIRIINGNHKWLNWLVYSFFTLCGVYTFYFAILVVFAEGIYLFLNLRKSKRIVFYWVLAQSSILALFSFWMPNFLMQFSKIARSPVVVAEKGFYVRHFHIGSLVRSVAGSAGLDPIFLSGGIHSYLSRNVLYAITIFSLFIFCGIIFLAIKFFINTAKLHKFNASLFPILITASLALGGIWHFLSKGAVISRYFISVSAFFCIVLLGALSLIKRKIVFTLVIAIILTLCILRLPEIYSPQEQWKEAVTYIESNFETGDCVLFFRSGHNAYNYYAHLPVRQITFAEYMTKDKKTFDFKGVSPEQSRKLNNSLKSFKRIWIILVHYHIFGGVDMMKAWLSDNGYELLEENDLKGIRILLYQNK